MKSYREAELKSYVIANILVYILMCNGINVFLITDGTNMLQFIAEVLNITIISSTIYAFVYVMDSVYSGNLKMKAVFFPFLEPGKVIFKKIYDDKTIIRFSSEVVNKYYSHIYEEEQKITNKREKEAYENQQWYQIYHRYRDVEMVASSARDFRLCRDMYMATFNILVVYISLSFMTGTVVFKPNYLIYLAFMLFITNIAARNKGKKWVYNVVVHDLSERQMMDASSPNSQAN